MKTALLTVCLGLLTAGGATAQSKSPTPPADQPKLLAVVTTNKADAQVVTRTNRLTDKMARQLRLNNYQTNRLRQINLEKVARMAEIERRYPTDPARVDADCKGVCDEKEREIRALLSTSQYSDYYSARNDFYTFDKQFLTEPRDQTRNTAPQTQYALPGQPEPAEIKNATPDPVLKQGPKGRRE